MAALSSVAAKAVHIYASLDAIPLSDILAWGLSFIFQDVLLLLFMRCLIDIKTPAGWYLLANLAVGLIIGLFFLYIIVIDLFSTAFFIVCNVEIHWRHISLAGDPSSAKLFLAGLATFLFVVGAVVSAAWLLQRPFYAVFGYLLDCFCAPTRSFYNRLYTKRCNQIRPQYTMLTQDELDSNSDISTQPPASTSPTSLPFLSNVGFYSVHLLFIAQLILLCIRPEDGSLTFLSWTPPVLPFVEASYSVSGLVNLKPVYNSGIGRDWDKETSLRKVTMPAWLPNDAAIPGFDDWYQGRLHYSAKHDKLKISNLQQDVHNELKDKLSGLNIRNVMMVMLESTRKDLFPIKKDSYLYKRLAKSFPDGMLPPDAEERLATLTTNANFITGDYDDGFSHNNTKRRGGINFNNAYTTSTYTVKSTMGNTCGITPMLGDFNRDYNHHIYQPCLPHIFSAFNTAANSSATVNNYTSFPWRSRFMMSSTLEFDHSYQLMDGMGYDRRDLVSREYLRSKDAKFGPVDLPDINAYAMEETPLQDYIRDAFASAKSNNERVWLTHLTSTSHYTFNLPERERYVPVAKDDEDLSRYVNAVGFDDRWLGRILDILEEESVANETLVVFVGDHGLSLPENGIVSTYYQPHAGFMKVPLVLSHPSLPAIDIDEPVSTQQILPTVLDALLETKSLAKPQGDIARDLIKNYEGQSLLRPHINTNNDTGQGDWHFTIINPGSGMLATRDARRPNWRLIVPTAYNVVWRFTDMETDPSEERPIISFKFKKFVRMVEETHGIEAAKWAEEGAFVARWWSDEHHKRWRSGPYEE